MSDNISPKEVTRCPCESTKDDGGLMIQCDICKTWQHARCVNIKSKSKVPKKYLCHLCAQTKKVKTDKAPKIEKKDKRRAKDKKGAGPSVSSACGVASTPSTSFSPVASTSSGRRSFHDENLLYHGRLPTFSRRQDDAAAQRRSEGLKQSFEISGGLQEIKDYMHALKQKIKIAGPSKRAKMNFGTEEPNKKDGGEEMDCEQAPPKQNEANENAEIDFKQEEPKKEVANEDVEMGCVGDGDVDCVQVEPVENNDAGDVPNEFEHTGLPAPARLVVDDPARMNLLRNILDSHSQVAERLQEYTLQIEDLNTNYPVGDGHDEDEDETDLLARMNSLINDIRTLKKFADEA